MQKVSLAIFYVLLVSWVLSNQFNKPAVNINKQPIQNQVSKIEKPNKQDSLPLINSFLIAGREEDLQSAIKLFKVQSLEEETRNEIKVIFRDRKIFDEVKRLDIGENVVDQELRAGKQEYKITGKVIYFNPPAAKFSLVISYNQNKNSWEISSIKIQR